MNLDTHFNRIMELLLHDYSHKTITIEQIIHSIDLTLLDESASAESLLQLNQDANHYQVAALCVYPQHIQQLSKSSSVPLATVINFPQGNEELHSSCTTIEKAIQLGVTEIDYVLPYSLYLNNNQQHALHQCNTIIQLCKREKLTVKIILETGLFPDMSTIYIISKELIKLGCDFIKTSTGKVPQGASLAAAFAILSAIQDTNNTAGIKLSGGIKKIEEAFHYVHLAELITGKPINKNWFRIGASSLLNELLPSTTMTL